MWLANSAAHRKRYPDPLKHILNIADTHKARQSLAHWSLLNGAPTPLRELPGLARHLGIAGLCIKDESERSILGSFKALGAPLALLRLAITRLPHANEQGLLNGEYRDRLADMTVISATDGNHGRALAAAANSLGCACVIVLHAGVAAEREAAIAAWGARIVRIAGNYDDSVVEAGQLATTHGWQVVSDTSYAGYEDIPRDIMQGYTCLAAEIVEQTANGADALAEPLPFTHVLLQGGVGGLAAGIASFLWEHTGVRRPHFIVVEPEQADCLYQSAARGRAADASGTVNSVMAGLACGKASPLAWQILAECVDNFMTVSDDDAVRAMQILAFGTHGDIPVVAGESGAAGLAGLCRLLVSPDQKRLAGLDPTSRVLLVNTEGATAPLLYENLVGANPDSIREKQLNWRPTIR